MPVQNKLFLIQDIGNSARTRRVADRERDAMKAVADWIDGFVTRPHRDLGRAGPVCPFVLRAVQHNALWLAPERIANLGVEGLVEMMSDYRRILLRSQPIEGDDANDKAIVVVFSDSSADRAAEYLGDIRIKELKRTSYAEHGVVMGEFHQRNEGSAIRNPGFQPFKSPVPFLLLRPAVISDWMFFLDDDDWLGLWARRYGESAVPALAARLRQTNWRRIEA